MTDLLIRGGRIIDGTGTPAFDGDIAVEAGSITAVGEVDLDESARVTLDARGLVVSPGFIDMHAHSELALLAEPEHLPKVAQGVTTEVLGQDGLSYAPVDERALTELRERLRGWNGDPPSVTWAWRSVGEFLSEYDRAAAVNVAYLVPHGTVRLVVMGTDDRSATADELGEMAALVGAAMTEGAVGLSTGLTYVPAMYADDDEVAALCRVVAATGGFYAPHHRNYGSRALESYAECISLGKRAGVAVHLTHAHLGFDVNQGRAGELLSMVDEARQRGLDVTLDSYPYLAGASFLHAFLPGWAQEGDTETVVRRLSDPAVRTRLRAELARGTSGTQGIPIDWSSVVVAGVAQPRNEGFVGVTIEAAAVQRGVDPFDLFVDLLVDERLGAACLIHCGNEENVRAIMRHPAHMAGSDGLLYGQHPHPRAFGTFPRYLGHYSRDLGVVQLEDMVRKMTSLPARRLGLVDRGLLRSGFAADIVCFDPDGVRDTATYDSPRLLPEGIPYVIVNGDQVIAEGRHTGALPGRALTSDDGGTMSGTFDTRLLAFMSDFAGEGTDNALAKIKNSGVGGVTVALAYHTARDVFPHNPSGEVIYQEGGTVYFQPDLDRYGVLKPVEAELTQGTRLSATVTERGRQLDLRIGAWVVVLHNTRLATLHQECAQETAAGDRLIHALCPSNPDVRTYALALVEDVAARGFDHLLVEALTFMPFDHGYHHERALIELDARTRFLLGLCFCPHCLIAGEAAGSDVTRLRQWVRAEVRRVFADGDALSDLPPDREWAWSSCDGELGRYLAARTDTISGLAAAAARTALAAGAGEVGFIDPSGAMLGYATGHPDTTERAVDIGWRVGVTCDRIGEVMNVAATAYFADPARLRREMEAYLDTVPPSPGVHVILRPMPPDTRSGPELISRMRALPSQGVRVVSFYHYGLMRLESLEWIRKALEATEDGDR